MNKSRVIGLALAAMVFGSAAAAQTAARGASGSDYPTAAVADYVLGCMAANGETREALESCSCSIDVISTLLPYDRYERAEAFLSLGHITGERGAIFKTSKPAHEAIEALRRAQIEADLRCF